MWPVEKIPNEDAVYFRIHKSFIVAGNLKPRVFQERGTDDGKSMSTDWSKYASPEDSKLGAKVPEDNGIVSFNVGELRGVKLNVEHAPLENNRAHTDVNGLPNDLRDVELRTKMLDIFKWEILPLVEVNQNSQNFRHTR